MFALASLLCSSIFFNSKHDFNHEKLMEIGLVEDLYRKIKMSDNEFTSTVTPEGKNSKQRVSSHESNK